MKEDNTIVYSYNKDTKMYTINSKEMQKINRKLKERFTLKQENKQLKEREKKLIKIEEMYKSGSVDLDELYEVVMGEK